MEYSLTTFDLLLNPIVLISILSTLIAILSLIYSARALETAKIANLISQQPERIAAIKRLKLVHYVLNHSYRTMQPEFVYQIFDDTESAPYLFDDHVAKIAREYYAIAFDFSERRKVVLLGSTEKENTKWENNVNNMLTKENEVFKKLSDAMHKKTLS